MESSADRPADVELAGGVADDHGIGQEAVRRDAAPQRALGGDAHGIGGDLESGDTELLKMGLPRRRVGKGAIGMRRQPGDHRPGQRPAAHVGHRHGRPAEIRGSCGGSSTVVPNQVKWSLPICVQTPLTPLCRAPVSSTVTQAAVAQAGAQHIASLVDKSAPCRRSAGARSAAWRWRCRSPPHLLDRRATVTCPWWHWTSTTGAALARMAMDAGRQRRRHRPPVRRQPTLPAIAGHLRAQHQILHDETLIALEARARRHRHRDDPLLVDDQLRRLILDFIDSDRRMPSSG